MVGMHFGMLSERWMDELFNISLMRLRCVYSCTKAFDDERRLENIRSAGVSAVSAALWCRSEDCWLRAIQP